MSERSIPKMKELIRGVLNFEHRCRGCGYLINKATGEYCHECEGGHDVHNHSQAISLLHKRHRDRTIDLVRKGETGYEI